MQRKICILAAAALLATASAASADPFVTETCTDSIGATVITYDCALEDTAYTAGAILTVTVSWNADAGMAMYDTLTSRKPYFTPRAMKDAVEGTEPTVVSVVDGNSGSVTFEFLYTTLHETGNGGKGNAKFFLYLKVDEDGDGAFDEKSAKFGVNVHVEEGEAAAAVRRLELKSDDGGSQAVSWGSLKSGSLN